MPTEENSNLHQDLLHGGLMKSLLVATIFLILVSFDALGQSAFSSAGERLISVVKPGEGVQVAVQSDGSALVTLPDGVQWFDAGLNPVSGIIGNYDHAILPLALPRNRWGIMKIVVNPNRGGNCILKEYRYWLFDGQQFLDTSAVLFLRSVPTDGTHATDQLLYVSAFAQDDTILWSDGVESYASDVGSYVWIETAQAQGGALDVSKMGSPLWSRRTGLWSYTRLFPPTEKYEGQAWAAYSPPRDGKYFAFERVQTSSTDPLANLSQSVSLRALGKDTVLKTISLEPVLSTEIDFSPSMMIGKDGNGYLFLSSGLSDSIGVRKISNDGSAIWSWRYLVNGVYRNWFRLFVWDYCDQARQNLYTMPEYTVRLLDDGTSVLVWTGTQPDGSTDIFAALLDENMTMIGSPTRVNSDRTGNQYGPTLAVNGKYVAISWMDERSGKPNAYLRLFTTDQLLDTQSPPAAGAFTIQDIAPNPAHGRATIRYTFDAAAAHDVDGVTFVVHDMLGRVVLQTQSGASYAGSNTANLDLKGLSAGAYRVVLQSYTKTASKSIFVY